MERSCARQGMCKEAKCEKSEIKTIVIKIKIVLFLKKCRDGQRERERERVCACKQLAFAGTYLSVAGSIDD